jgi:DNA-binding beta-propeller fold protein YncE
VRAWPTQVLIDTAGYVVAQVAGEGHYSVLDGAIGELVAEAKKRGTLDARPLKFALERAKTGDLPLAFPGKVLADERGDRLFVADSNHNRVVVTKLDGTFLYSIGSGARGRRDGAFQDASFDAPQGLVLDPSDNSTLYVADTRNHLLRRVDLKGRTVETAAGTGAQSRDHSLRGGPALTTPLSSPWDLALAGRALYVAMAGPHQVWKLDLDTRQVSLYAGTGREARSDGKRLGDFKDPEAATFAQPSGLAFGDATLYVADSESNIVRAVTGEEVRTLAGGDLFEFGDRDGEGDAVRFQHPLGLALVGGRLFVADTYNHKLKVLDPRNGRVSTFAGTGKPGQTDGARPEFYEPGGISPARGKLYVADTNNHAVRVVDLATKQTKTLVLSGLKPPDVNDAVAEVADLDEAAPHAEWSKLPPQLLAAAGDATLVVEVALPAGHHLNPDAPNRYTVTVEGGAQRLAAGEPGAGDDLLALTGKVKELPLRVPLRAFVARATRLRVSLRLYYCREDNTGVCRMKPLAWTVPLKLTAEPGAPHEVKLQGKVE